MTATYYTSRPSTAGYEGYWDTVVDPDGVTRDRMQERDQYLDDIKAELKFLKSLPVGRILDVGCGPGWLWAEMEGWDRYGVETDKLAAEHAGRHCLSYNCEVDDTDFGNDYFDVIVMHHVIEHMEDPVSDLAKVHDLLKPGGILLLGTPDFDSPCARLFGENYRLLHDQTHVSLFTKESMTRLLQDSGFVIDRVDLPFFETRHFTEENLLRMLDTSMVSPPFVGNFMTFYCHKATAGKTEKPWGSWEIISRGEGWQVKILTFIPGGALSLQRHQHRRETWCIASGEGLVTIDDRQYMVCATPQLDVVYIPLGVAHRIQNTGPEPLIVVETQWGDYLGEDDLERLEDQYNRPLGKVDPAND